MLELISTGVSSNGVSFPIQGNLPDDLIINWRVTPNFWDQIFSCAWGHVVFCKKKYSWWIRIISYEVLKCQDTYVSKINFYRKSNETVKDGRSEKLSLSNLSSTLFTLPPKIIFLEKHLLILSCDEFFIHFHIPEIVFHFQVFFKIRIKDNSVQWWASANL